MKRKILIYTLLTTVLLVMATAVRAQSNQQLEMARHELERTDEIIQRATEAVMAVNSPIAIAALEKARTLQSTARNYLHGGHPYMAYKQTLKAREYAKKAIAASRLSEQGENVVLRKLERANELLGRAKELLGTSSDSRLNAVYESARNNLNRAWEFYRARNYRPALTLANQVIKASQQIISALNQEIRKHADFERRYEMVGDAIEKARQAVVTCTAPKARQLVDQATVLYQRAREAASQGNILPALRHLQKAHRLANEVLKICNGTSGGLASYYQRLKNEAERLAEERTSLDRTAQQRLDEVFDQLRLADTYIRQGKTEAASAALKAAQLTLKQIKKSLPSDNR